MNFGFNLDVETLASTYEFEISIGGVPYEPETTSLLSRMEVAPSELERVSINQTIQALKATTVWDKLLALYVLASHSRQAAKLNWKADQFNLTEINGANLTFTPNVGMQGNGAALNTGFNPSVHGDGIYTQNSGAIGFMSWTPDQSNNMDMGASFTGLRCRNGLNRVVHKVNSNGVNGYFEGIPDGSGLFVSSRTGPGNADNRAYKDGSLLAATGQPGVATALENKELWVLGANDAVPSYSIRGCQMAFISAGLTAAEVGALYDVFAG